MKTPNITFRFGTLELVLHWTLWLWLLVAALLQLILRKPDWAICVLQFGVVFVFSTFIHEWAHWIVARMLRVPIRKIILHIDGGMLLGVGVYKIHRHGGFTARIIFNAAGCVTNLVLTHALLALSPYWIPLPAFFSQMIIFLIFINLFNGILNLIPLSHSDGNRLFLIFCEMIRTNEVNGKMPHKGWNIEQQAEENTPIDVLETRI